jgi:hypothetical protein
VDATSGGNTSGRSTNLFHDASLALGKGDVAARLVGDELDLNLPTFAVALFVIIVVIISGAGTGTLGATRLAAIADRVRLIEVGRRGLVVLIRDVGHCRGYRGV